MTKHFPGGGPQQDGEDPHFEYGREQVYPGGQFELHLKPFEAAFAAGTRQIMPYYGMPVGTEHEEVGFGFNKSVITGSAARALRLRRRRLHRLGPHQRRRDLRPALPGARVGRRAPHPARAHGQGPRGRRRPVRRRGLPRAAARARRDGAITEERLDVSARRLLREKFELGLFENPFVDEDAADQIVGRADFRAAGDAAQRASITVLTNAVDGCRRARCFRCARGAAALRRGHRPRGRRRSTATVVDTPAEADAAILRLQAPYEQRGTMFENFFHAGSLEFPADVLAHVARGRRARCRPWSTSSLDRPAILEPIVEVAAAVSRTGARAPRRCSTCSPARPSAQGRLPFDLPRSMAAVEASRPDVPFDTADPLFRFGHGLSCSPRPRARFRFGEAPRRVGLLRARCIGDRDSTVSVRIVARIVCVAG